MNLYSSVAGGFQRDAYVKTFAELEAIDADDDDEGIRAIADWIVERIREKETLPGSRDVRREAAKFCRSNGIRSGTTSGWGSSRSSASFPVARFRVADVELVRIVCPVPPSVTGPLQSAVTRVVTVRGSWISASRSPVRSVRSSSEFRRRPRRRNPIGTGIAPGAQF